MEPGDFSCLGMGEVTRAEPSFYFFSLTVMLAMGDMLLHILALPAEGFENKIQTPFTDAHFSYVA